MARQKAKSSRTCKLLCSATVVHMSDIIVLLYGLSLALDCSLDDCLGKECQELRYGAPLIEREAGYVSRRAENCAGRGRGCMGDRQGVDLHCWCSWQGTTGHSHGNSECRHAVSNQRRTRRHDSILILQLNSCCRFELPG